MIGIQTINVVVGTTSTAKEMPPNTVSLLLRCPSTNAANVFVNVGGNFAGANDILVQPGESVNLSQELWLVFKAILQAPINANDYIKQIVSYSTSAAQTLYVDCVTWSGV